MRGFTEASPRHRSPIKPALIGLALFITGLAVGGFLANREHGSRPGLQNTATSAGPDAGTAATSVGPTVTKKGAPAGFARSEQGAVAAAAAFVTTGQNLLDMDPLAAEMAFRQMAASATADGQAHDLLLKLDAARAALSKGEGPITFRQSALAWRVAAFTPARATVAIWNVSVLSRDGIAPPQAGWAISTLDLVWEDGDWHIWSETIAPGPAPILDNSAAPATSQQLDSALNGFTDFETAR